MINEIGASTSALGKAAPAAPGGALGKDEFLKMLVAQMRNQDPMNPMKGDEMAAQLAQFSSLEQLTNISDGLEQLTSVFGGQMLQSMHAATAMGAIGRTVVALGDKVRIGEGLPGEVTVDVGARGAATLKIYDASGREVGSREVGGLGAGRHTIELGKAAEGLPEGTYTYALEVVNSAGEPVPTQTYMRVRIDGVRYGPNGPILTGGGFEMPFGEIAEIVSD